MASPSDTLSLEQESEAVLETGPLKRKHGAGCGGAGAKYCSMSLWQRKGGVFVLQHLRQTYFTSAKKTLLHRVAELVKKRPMGLLVRLCFITDHCATLQSTLDLAQEYGSGCFLYTIS